MRQKANPKLKLQEMAGAKRLGANSFLVNGMEACLLRRLFLKTACLGKKRIYDSVMDSAESLAEVYGNCIDRNGKSFEALSEAAQLAKSSLSIALRKEVVDANRFHEQKYIKNYFSEELAAAARLVKFAERTQCVNSAFVTNEEELGIKLGKGFVVAMQFVGNLDKLSTHERIFLDSFNNYTSQILDEGLVLI